jgi:dTDP-glucose 4,6-dehydratase
LGWRPRVDFRQGIRDTIDWYLAHSEWVRHVRSGDYLKYYEEQYGKRPRKDPE